MRRTLPVLALLTLIASLLLAVPAGAVEDVTPARVDAPNRVATAADLARLAHAGGVDTAVIATSQDYEDALAGAGLAGSSVAAQLLVRPDEVPAETAQALDDLGVQQILLLGDTARISADVEDELAQERDVTRISAATPPQLAAAIADRIVSQTGIPSVGGERTVFIASDAQLADALAGSSPAYLAGIPILYTTAASLHPSTQEFLSTHEIDTAVVLGGELTITPAVTAQLEAQGITAERLAGPSRVETSLEVANWAAENLEYPQEELLIARGDEFPDSLTAAQYGGPLRNPIILTATPTETSESALNWIRTRCPVIQIVRAVGGQVAVSQELLDEIETAAESCADDGTPPGDDPGATGQTYEVEPLQAQEGDPGTTFELRVARRTDDQAFTGPVDIVLFGCEGADVLGSGDDTFADADDDDTADGFGSSDTGAAEIVSVNGATTTPTTVLPTVSPGADGVLTFEVAADAPDCTIPVVVAGDGDGELDLDAQDRPVEDYGVGHLSWS